MALSPIGWGVLIVGLILLLIALIFIIASRGAITSNPRLVSNNLTATLWILIASFIFVLGGAILGSFVGQPSSVRTTTYTQTTARPNAIIA